MATPLGIVRGGQLGEWGWGEGVRVHGVVLLVISAITHAGDSLSPFAASTGTV